MRPNTGSRALFATATALTALLLPLSQPGVNAQSPMARCFATLPGPARSLVITAAQMQPLLRRESELIPCDVMSASDSTSTSPVIGAAPASMIGTSRSGYAGGANDGALWAGKGVSGMVSAGVFARVGALTMMVAPELVYAANDSFALRPQTDSAYSPYADPFYPGLLDRPRLMGGSSMSRATPGQSYVRIDVSGFNAGVSTQNLWAGPGVRSSLLLSNHAQGFPHAFAGARIPVPRVGVVTANAIAGRTAESDYYDTIPGNDDQTLLFGQLQFEPAVLEGLQVAVSGLRGGSRDPHIALSLAARLFLEAERAVFYAEFARSPLRDSDSVFAALADRTRHGLVLGIQKTSNTRAGDVTVGGELTALQRFEPIDEQRVQLAPTWYVGGPRGLTNRGEVLGSWIGPGGDGQLLFVELERGASRFAVSAERVRRNESALYAVAREITFVLYQHDVEYTGGFEYGRHFGPITVAARVDAARRMNREFGADDSNLQATLRLDYHGGHIWQW